MSRMTRADALAYALAKPGAWQDEPWEGDLVAKVGDKIFAFLGSQHADPDGDTEPEAGSVGVKSGRTRDDADEWIARYPNDARVMPYIGRYGWNTLDLGGSIPAGEIREAIDASYADVVARLPRSRRPA